MAFALMLFAALAGFGSAVVSALVVGTSFLGFVGIYLKVTLGVFCLGSVALLAIVTALRAFDRRGGAWPLAGWAASDRIAAGFAPTDAKSSTRSA